MSIVWRTGPVTVKQVLARLLRERAYSTVQTTLDRLYRKSPLTREKESHAFVYTPRVIAPSITGSFRDLSSETCSSGSRAGAGGVRGNRGDADLRRTSSD